jgi:abequosyltransferase
MDTKLSVCVPVYNCAEFLGQALDSVLSQIDERVELVVYDGGSRDSTPDLMRSYASRWPSLRYYRSDRRGGIDADLSRCVELAKGEYCWLFSGDDVMRPGAIARALDAIGSAKDVYVCAHTLCKRNMEFTQEYPPFSPDVYLEADWSEEKSRQRWFNHAVTTEAFFSFMSSLLVRRDKWMGSPMPDEFIGSCWGHVARLFGSANSGLTVCYVGEIWLDKRGGNDSFIDKGIVNRFRIAIEGYHNIANIYFGKKSMEAFHIRRVIRNEFGLGMFLSAKLLCKNIPEQENKILLDYLVMKTYSDFSLCNYSHILLYRAIPVRLYELARLGYRRTLKMMG